MNSPVQTVFRNMAVSQVLSHEVEVQATHLQTYCPDIVSCRAVVEVPHHRHAHGNTVHVRLEIGVPGDVIVVTHEPSLHSELKRRAAEEVHKAEEADPTSHAAVTIRDAFDVAKRRLEDFARRQRGDVKTHMR